jgi:hypothetical protein
LKMGCDAIFRVIIYLSVFLNLKWWESSSPTLQSLIQQLIIARLWVMDLVLKVWSILWFQDIIESGFLHHCSTCFKWNGCIWYTKPLFLLFVSLNTIFNHACLFSCVAVHYRLLSACW